ncbi:ImmA/IrrE family metallo-endopeptidase [Microvirga tunisiensis]|uniref:ImmA/IrrE family metallo-endopeptidase n=2 Tax=Microvirga tunisiensis TaxID=2108360 RepID=A0A5N7MDA2_9HYPH|nr:ImmA/IrrE family metallo-endopeptidase [Microvirga tunisiensis]MPR24084.1 ImmA/IrrE family metallo-endopeptidase [Microvirga tunisiensis]
MVYWMRDPTRRFRERPFYRPEEIDAACERLVNEFLLKHRGKVEYPLTTDDLTILIERNVRDLDLYADLSDDGTDVEGVTRFAVGHQPAIAIADPLSSDERRANRLRTTLAHELGHAKFHDEVFQMAFSSGDLLSEAREAKIVCKRETMIDAPQTDWMEWQACYASGAYLMPRSAVHDLLRPAVTASKRLPPFHVAGEEAPAFIEVIIDRFAVSKEAAKVRLIKLGFLTTEVRTPTLFD